MTPTDRHSGPVTRPSGWLNSAFARTPRGRAPAYRSPGPDTTPEIPFAARRRVVAFHGPWAVASDPSVDRGSTTLAPMPLSLESAQTVIAGAHAHARQLGVRITVAVVDEGGLLQALGRMDGAPPLSAQIAEAKAVGAALWHRDGGELAEVHRERPAFFAQVDRLARLPIIPGRGSLLIRQGDSVLGAVGVSGATAEQDEECARAGLARLP